VRLWSGEDEVEENEDEDDEEVAGSVIAFAGIALAFVAELLELLEGSTVDVVAALVAAIENKVSVSSSLLFCLDFFHVVDDVEAAVDAAVEVVGDVAVVVGVGVGVVVTGGVVRGDVVV